MRYPYVFLAVAILVGVCCSRQKPPAPETALFRDFSLASVVDGMKLPELQSISGGSGGSESLGSVVRRRRDFDLTYKITDHEGSRFDEDKFIDQLKDQTEMLVRAANARLDAGGSGKGSFHVDYSDPGHVGSLEVFGTRAEGNQLRLWGVIRERTESPLDQ
jgi:hypothetical protein